MQGRAKICQNRPLQLGGFSPFKCSKGDWKKDAMNKIESPASPENQGPLKNL